MRLSFLLCIAVVLQVSLAALKSRTPSTFQPVLPANGTLVYAVLYSDNSTFDQSVYGLPGFCALYVNVTYSSPSSFEFGLWLPSNT